MDKDATQKTARKSGGQVPLFDWAFDKMNLIVVLAALVVIIIGYVFLGIGPYDSAQSKTIGPVLLVLGYLVVLPLGIIVRKK